MDLSELEAQLLQFCRDKYQSDTIKLLDVFKMPGHAGFSYGFSVLSEKQMGAEPVTQVDKWYIRLPPPNVKHVGTADVLRQVAVLNVLPDSVPHCKVRWSGDDSQWFGRPFFVVPQLEGDVIRVKEARIKDLSYESRTVMARQAIKALVEIHRVDWRLVPYLGEPIPLQSDVTRWDRFVEKAADPEKLALVPEVRQLLLEKMPGETQIGIFHGDFQWSNLFYAFTNELIAVIDWELVGIGSTLNDVGWFATFNDPEAWADANHADHPLSDAGELIAMYEQEWGAKLPDIDWFRALAAYKFAIITGFNLMLHRRGKRHDPVWETSKDSMESLLLRAKNLLQYQRA